MGPFLSEHRTVPSLARGDYRLLWPLFLDPTLFLGQHQFKKFQNRLWHLSVAGQPFVDRPLLYATVHGCLAVQDLKFPQEDRQMGPVIDHFRYMLHG